MTTNIILECRQNDTKSVLRNGIYESYLANDVIIEEGDVVLLKNAYIDTKKEGNINIENDLILTINYGVYFTDWLEDPTSKIEYINSSGVNIWNPPTGAPTGSYNLGAVYKGQRFIPYYFQSSAGVEYQSVVSVTYKALGQVFGEQSPDMPVTYQYQDALTGNIVTAHRTIPASEPEVVYTDSLGFLIKSGSFQIISPSFNDMETDYYWKYISQDVVDVASNGVFSPYIFTKTITLPADTYSPSDLSLFISKQMSANNINGYSATISGDSFVKFVSEFNAGMPYPNGATGTIPDVGTYFFSDDMTTRFRFGSSPPANSPNYIFGASQTALEFDPDSNTFNWAYLHTPMYDDNANISCRLQNIGAWNTPPNVKPNYIKTTDNGGIFFTGLSAKTAIDGKRFDFWSGVLGFDLDKITVESRQPVVTGTNSSYFGLEGTFYSYILTPAINITSGYSGIDNSIIKTGSWYTLASVANPQGSSGSPALRQGGAIFSTINTTTALIADTPYSELIDTFSHYIIDADLHFIGDYVGLDKYNNIQGTVSKYYQVANYVVGSSDGAIQYEHKGFPIMLKSIKVRILRSDKTEDPNLGKDNTILFQLIKSNEITKSK